jgi:biotin carboxylase
MNTNKIFYIQIQIKAEHVAHTFNPSTQEAEAGGFPGQPGLQSEFQDSQGYKEKPYLEKSFNNSKARAREHKCSIR